MNTLSISKHEKNILRSLAKRVKEISQDPIYKQNELTWLQHNDLKRVKPMVLAFPEGSWRELLPAHIFVCKDEFFRRIEFDLRMRIYYHDYMQDDNVIDDIIYSPIIIKDTGWGLECNRTPSDTELGSWHIDPVLIEESDADKLKIPDYTVDWEESEKKYVILSEIFGDILHVKKRGQCVGGICPVDRYSQLRGIDNMFMDLVDKPDLVHKVVDLLVQGEIKKVKTLEKEGALSLGNTNNYVGSGGTGYTKQLPSEGFDGIHVRTLDLWGFATAQIFSEVSPAMHEEFALKHEKKFLELFGLNCYGCCEPLHNKLDVIIKHVPRLRRISISPWADVKIASEKLQDKYIFSWKPNPAVLAAEEWAPDSVRSSLTQFCEQTKGNIVEIIMKDTHTVRNQPHRFHEWVKIAKEVAEQY